MRIFALVLILGITAVNTKAANSDSALFLIPQPKSIEIKNGVFNFGKSYTVNIANANQFYSQQLQTAITNKFKTKEVSATKAIYKIQLLKADSAGFAQLIKTEKLSLPFDLGAEGYVLSVSSKSILIVAHENAGVFYGVQTLIQIINANSKGNTIPCLVIYDKPDMQMRGWQDDISRGPIPTLDFLKEEIRRMASFKLNTFTLYTEHVFKLKQHPSIAPVDGITEEEIKELTKFAADYNVDIIGNFQSFGHFKNILQVPGYETLGENEHTLSPAKEESYKFLKEVYSEVVPAYNSKYFHINCDEVSLGNGPCKTMIDSIGVDGVYAYHINRIDSLLKPYHKRIMMWGDIAVKHPNIIDRLPKNMIIVSWGYAEMESMDEEILPFVKSGFEFIVAPGVNCWSRIYPDMQRSSINIYNYLRDGYKNKCIGFINTTWDDDGQNLFNNNWYSLVWGADCGWNAPVNAPVKESEVIRKNRVAAFNRSYNKVYFETNKDIASLLKSVSDLKYGVVKNCLSTSSIWNALLPNYNIIPENYESDNLNLIKTIDSLLSKTKKLESSFSNRKQEFATLQFALRQARLVANKNLLGIKLKSYIKSGTLKNISFFEKDFAALSDTIAALKTVYGKLWKLENRNWWLDTVYANYNSFAQKLNELKDVCVIKASDKLMNGKREISLRSAFNNLPVYYTTDGTIPNLNSTKYSQPIYTDSSIYIKARVIINDTAILSLSKGDVQSDSLIFHKCIGALHKLNCKWNVDNPVYAARGEFGLLDGRRGDKSNFNDGRWQAYFGGDINIELDFDEVIPINKITMGFAQLMRYGILYPTQIEISTSTDGINYTLVKTEINTIEQNTEKRSTNDYIIPLDGIHSRYLKIVAKNISVLPEWHYAKGKTGWLYADEIIVE